jgi:hypothetical protein
MPFHVEEKRKLGDCVLTGANLGTIAADAVHSIPGNRHDQDSLADYRCLDYPRLPDSQSAAQHTGGGPGGTVASIVTWPVSNDACVGSWLLLCLCHRLEDWSDMETRRHEREWGMAITRLTR